MLSVRQPWRCPARLPLNHAACRDPTRLNLALFQNLSSLELVNCDLSTSALAGFSGVRASLRALTSVDSLEELRHLLAPASGALQLPGVRPWAFKAVE